METNRHEIEKEIREQIFIDLLRHDKENRLYLSPEIYAIVAGFDLQEKEEKHDTV